MRTRKCKDFYSCFLFFEGQALTQLIINGRIYDLVRRDVAVSLCRLCPAQLSDGWADDVEGQPSRFTRHCRTHKSKRLLA